RRVRIAEPFDELVRTRTVLCTDTGSGPGGEHPIEMRILRVTFLHAGPPHSRLLPHGCLHLALSLFTMTFTATVSRSTIAHPVPPLRPRRPPRTRSPARTPAR